MKGERVIEKVPVTTYEEKDTITISGITLEDAQVLMAITRVIGGLPNGPRGAADRLSAALTKAGVKLPWRDVSGYPPKPNPAFPFVLNGSIFIEYKNEK